MNSIRRRSWWLPLLLGAAGCWRASPASTPFVVVRTSPDLSSGAPVLLNETLTIYFSDAILPLSVTADSVTIVDDAGHQVPGSLRAGANWVTFVPEPPLSPELDDGSFRPGSNYHLLISGFPRPDAVRALDGRRLADAAAFEVHAASRDEHPADLPAPLRPPPSDLPFVLRVPEISQQLPADAPRVYLHFTLPVLPSSVTPEAFGILRILPRIGEVPEELVPRSTRVVSSRIDEFPGSTVEIDIGSLPRRRDSTATVHLQKGDLIFVSISKEASLRDYSGAPLLSVASQSQSWHVIDGTSIALLEWPSGQERFAPDDALSPGFEQHADVIRPRVRVEAGDGSLGVFRPHGDVTLRAGVPFDRGDGQLVVSRGSDFPFLAVDIPDGVKVTIDAANAPVRLLVAGGMRIAGEVELIGAALSLPTRRLQTPPVQELADGAAIAWLAAGSVDIGGRIHTAPGGDGSPLLIATADRMLLHGGELPLQTVLAFDAAMDGLAPAIAGPRGQSIVLPVTFTYGVPTGANFQVSGWTPWRQLPADHEGGKVQIVDRQGDLQVAWQSAPADNYHPEAPDLGVGRVSQSQLVPDGATIAVPASSFVRFELTARVRAGQEMPTLRELRLADR